MPLVDTQISEMKDIFLCVNIYKHDDGAKLGDYVWKI
jgi:hypothetical protein